MAILKCKKCNCSYFVQLPVNQFNDMTMDVNSGYRALHSDNWKVYMCLNEKCKTVIMPEMRSFTVSTTDMKHIEEMASALKGEVRELPDKRPRMPAPGEIMRR